jgi:CRISPR-associated protein Csh1
MEQSNESDVMVSQQRNKVETFQEKVEAFFQEMGYSENQKAMYYLGRALSSIASAQVKAKHPSKPILEKVNYNGMDVRSILKLYRELREKVKQYVKHNTIQFTEPHLSEFDKRFQPSDWNMNSDEALFFLFSGYSFYIKKEKTTEDEIN